MLGLVLSIVISHQVKLLIMNRLVKWLSYFLLLILTLFSLNVSSQDTLSDNYDHQLFVGNILAWSKGSWHYSGELQFRLKDDTRSFNMYYIEGIASYLANEKWEIVPDMRFSVMSDRLEYRPGLGIIYKNLWLNNRLNQLVHQLKWQTDIESTGVVKNAVRYVAFYNVVMNEKLLLQVAGGGLYRWSEAHTGFQFFRALVGGSYSFTKKTRFNFSYFVGYENRISRWSFIGGPVLQFVINMDKDSKYIPAKYFNF